MNLKNQIQTYLKSRGMTASNLSKLSGVPNATIADWLSGRKPRDFDKVKKIADVFKISMDHLIYGDGLESSLDEADLDALLGDKWISGMFEVKLRRVKR